MALPKDMRLKGHRTFNYINKNSIKYYGKLMTFRVAKSNPDILLSHNLTNTTNNFRAAIAISKKVSKKAVTRNKLRRLMKEAFRLSAKELLEDIVDYDFVFVYFGSDKVDFIKVEESMKSLLLSFRKKVLS